MTARCPFVAEAIMTRVRAGEFPEEPEAQALNEYRFLSAIRPFVQPEDVPRILDAVDRFPAERGGFAANLLRRFCPRNDIQCRIQRRWESADAALRVHLLWRLLDDPAIHRSWHDKLFGFVVDQWLVFRASLSRWYATPDQVIPGVIEAIADPDVPDSKRWAYLCCLPEIAGDQRTALAILRAASRSLDPLSREFADAILRRFFPDALSARLSAQGNCHRG